MTTTFSCDDKATLIAYLYGDVDAATRQRVDAHLETCARCAEEVTALASRWRDELKLQLTGLMCIPPVADVVAPHFALLAKMARRLGFSTLSMGMSGDFETAIAFGASYVRVGTAIFGTRARD